MPIIKKKIAVLGISKVGKTSLIRQLIQGKATVGLRYVPTVQDIYHHAMLWNGQMCNLDIIDTAGNNDFPAMKNLSIDTADGFILVYRAEKMESVRELETIYDLIDSRGKAKAPCVIVRNQFRNLANNNNVNDVSLNCCKGRHSPEETRKKCCDVVSVFLTTRGCKHVEISPEMVESAQKVFEELLSLFHLSEAKRDDTEVLLGKSAIRAGYTIDKSVKLENSMMLTIPKEKLRNRSKSM